MAKAIKKKPAPKLGWRKRFLNALRSTANVSLACEKAGISRPVAYRTKARKPGFSRAWDDVIQAAVDDVEMSLRTTALGGNVHAALAILRAHRPEIWSNPAIEQRSQAVLLQQNNVTNVQVVGNHSTEELLAFIDASRHVLESGPSASAEVNLIPITWEDQG